MLPEVFCSVVVAGHAVRDNDLGRSLSPRDAIVPLCV